MTAPPRPRRSDAVRSLHDIDTPDPYAWLRDDERTDAEVLAHLRAENEHAEAVLAGQAELREAIFGEIKGRTRETDLSVPERRYGWWYYRRTVEGSQYGIRCRVAAGTETDPPDPDDPSVRGQEQVLLDENAEAGDADYFALGVLDLAPDDGTLAWGFDLDGSEAYAVRFRDVSTGTDRLLPDGAVEQIDGAYYGSAWAADSSAFFYVRTDAAHRPHEVWRHSMGTPPSRDELVFAEADERFFVTVDETKDRRYVRISVGSKRTSEQLLCPADTPSASFTSVVARTEGIEVEVEHLDGRIYALTNDDARDFRLLAAPVDAIGSTSFDGWDEVWPHRPGVRLEGVDVLAGHLLLEERTEATTRVRILDLATGRDQLLDQPEATSTVELGSNDDLGWTQVRHVYESLTTPATVIDLDLVSGERFVRKVQEVVGGHDPAEYTSERLWAESHDGERIPISVVHRSDRAPGGPVLLYGYGAYEISIDPYFSIARLSLLDRGWAFAIAHVRGGGEMGRRWYEDGKEAAKTNSFDDLIACGRHLVSEGIGSERADGRTTVAIRGGSAGGLLVGAALNRAPEQWAAVVAEVPFVDALTTMIDPSLPLTVTEWEEWGNPVDDPAVAATMAAYAPVDNVPETDLPPVLATAGLHDPRVGYWEPAKWIATLRERASGGPFLLWTELGAGHGGPSGRYDAWRDEARVLAFLVDAVGSTPS